MKKWRDRIMLAGIALATPPLGIALFLNFMALGIQMQADATVVPQLDANNNVNGFIDALPVAYAVGVLPTLCAVMYMVRSVKRHDPLRYTNGWYASCVALSFLAPLPWYLALLSLSGPFNSSVIIILASHFLAASCSFFMIVAVANRLFFARRIPLLHSQGRS